MMLLPPIPVPKKQKRRYQRRWYSVIVGTILQYLRQCQSCLLQHSTMTTATPITTTTTKSTMKRRFLKPIFKVTIAVVLILLYLIIISLTRSSIRQVSFLARSTSFWNTLLSTTTSSTVVNVVPYPQCAPWLTHPNQRIIAFMDLSDMDNYYNTVHKSKMYRGGEFYMSAALDYAIRENGFTVQRIGIKSLLTLQQEKHKNDPTAQAYQALLSETTKYHRIISNGYDPWIQLNMTALSSSSSSVQRLLQPEQICKLRSIHWWGSTNQHYISSTSLSTSSNTTSIDDILPMFHHSQWLKPYPNADYYNTFIGYVPHSKILFPTYYNNKNKNIHHPQHDNDNINHNDEQLQTSSSTPQKVGLLFGKVSKSFRHSKAIIDALINDGFVLHTTCKDCTTNDSMVPPGVIRHLNMGPLEYIQLLQRPEISFLIGFGHPYDSPSPIEGLANGVAFINPIANHVVLPRNGEPVFPLQPPQHDDETSSYTQLRTTQHVPIQHLGPPYVYNVHLSNITQVLLAAKSAVQYRFHSYIPVDYHPLSFIARVCTTLLEDDSICTCPTKSSSSNIDCRGGSNAIRKSTTGDDANGVGNVSFH